MKEQMKVIRFNRGNRPWGLRIPATMNAFGKRQTIRFDDKQSAVHEMKRRENNIASGGLKRDLLRQKQVEARKIVQEDLRNRKQTMLILNQSEIEILKMILGRLS